MKIILRVLILIVLIVSSVPLYFSLCPEDWREVKEITENTYKELSETDEMYLDMPLGARISQISVKQQLGDAYVSVCIDVPNENIEKFIGWLEEGEKQYTQKKDSVYLSYFVSDSHAQFGERSESSSATTFTKIYWIILICIVIMICIPFEKIGKKTL